MRVKAVVSRLDNWCTVHSNAQTAWCFLWNEFSHFLYLRRFYFLFKKVLPALLFSLVQFSCNYNTCSRYHNTWKYNLDIEQTNIEVLVEIWWGGYRSDLFLGGNTPINEPRLKEQLLPVKKRHNTSKLLLTR